MAQNLAVAHEGNPRVDSLEVPGGSLQSDAIRTVKQGPGKEAPPATSPEILPPVDSPTGHASSGDKYVFSVDEQGNVNFVFAASTDETANGSVQEYSHRDGTDMYGFISVVPNDDIIYDTDTAQDISEDDVDLDRMVELLTTHYAATTQTAAHQVNATLNAVSGSPISGLAVAVDPASTIEEFYGFACVYDWFETTLYLLQYDGEPLTEFGTVLVSTTGSVAVDDLMLVQFNYNQNSGSPFIDIVASFGSLDVTDPTQRAIPASLVAGVQGAIVNIASGASHLSLVDDSVTWDEVSAFATWSVS